MFTITPSPFTRGVIIRTDKAYRHVRHGVRNGLSELGEILSKTAKDGITNPPKTGRYYKYKGRRHRASAPGEYPANRSGELRKSVIFIVKGREKLIFGAGGGKAYYAKYLEKGTVFMAPRTFLEKAHNANINKAVKLIGTRIYQEIIR